MKAEYSALIFALTAHCLAFFLLPRAVPISDRIRWIALWSINAVALFLLKDPSAVILTALAILLLMSVVDPSRRLGLFLVAAPALPVYLTYPLPFPGINYITDLTYYKLATLTLLVPLLFHGRTKEHNWYKLRLTDLCLVSYLIYTAIIVSDAINVTSGLRFLIDQLLLVAVPYVCLVLVVRRVDTFDFAASAVLASAVILGAITLIATAKQWDFYRLLEAPSIFSIPDVRSGFVRISATVNTHSLGYLFVFAILLLQYLKHRLRLGWFLLNGMRTLFLLSLYLTNSRGAMLSLALGAGVYVLCRLHNQALRRAAWAGICVGILTIATWLTVGDFSDLDPHGTIAYRQELLRTSLDYLADYPIFGNFHFMWSGKFDHLIQGQGIVDITNLYLQVALYYGPLGLLFFIPLFISPLRNLARPISASDSAQFVATVNTSQSQTAPRTGGLAHPTITACNTPTVPEFKVEDQSRARAVLAGALVGWLFLVTTTSDVGITIHLGIVIAALGRAWITIVADAENAKKSRAHDIRFPSPQGERVSYDSVSAPITARNI